MERLIRSRLRDAGGQLWWYVPLGATDDACCVVHCHTIREGSGYWYSEQHQVRCMGHPPVADVATRQGGGHY